MRRKYKLAKKKLAKSFKFSLKLARNVPTKETIKAMNQLKAEESQIFNSARELFISIK